MTRHAVPVTDPDDLRYDVSSDAWNDLVGRLAAVEAGGSGSVTADQKAALDANTSLDAGNPVASMADVGGGGAIISDTAPTDPATGQIWVQISDSLPPGTNCRPALVWDGAAWIPLGLAVSDVDGNLRAFVTLAETGGVSLEAWDATGLVQGGVVLTPGQVFFYTAADKVAHVALSDGSGPGQGFSVEVTDGLATKKAFSVTVADGPIWDAKPIGTQCANQPAIDPEVSAADAAFNTLRTAMIASGLMAPDAP